MTAPTQYNGKPIPPGTWLAHAAEVADRDGGESLLGSADDELRQARAAGMIALQQSEAERERADVAESDLAAVTAERDQARAEVERLHSWDGLMELLDEHWPEEFLPTIPDDDKRDPGPRIVSLIRWVKQARQMLADEVESLRIQRDNSDRRATECVQAMQSLDTENRQLHAVLADAQHDKTCGSHPMNGVRDLGCSCWKAGL